MVLRHSGITRRKFLGGISGSTAALAFGGPPTLASSTRPRIIPLMANQSEIDEWVIAQTAEAKSMDPLADFGVAALTIHAHLFNPLIDYEGPDLKLVPKLATSWEADGNVWTFKLRDGVKWHDGQDFTADDVKFTLEQAATDPMSTRRRYVSSIDQVETPDPLTVKITTKEITASLLASLAYVYILPRHVYEELGTEGFGQQPVGTGAYKFVSWALDQQLVIKANDQYWDGVPSPQRLVFRPITEPSTRLAELQTGGVDISKGIPTDLASSVESDTDRQLIVAEGVRQVYYPFQTLNPPLDEVKLRQAINFAVDRETITQAIMGGYGEVRRGPLAPGQMGHNPDATPHYAYDPDKAKALLQEAGADKIEVTWDMTSGRVVKDTEIAQFIANQLGDVGITVNVNVLEAATVIDNFRAGEFEMSQTTWSRQFDPDSVISGLGIESSVSGYYNNPDADALIVEGRRTVETAERAAVYEELYQELVRNPPFLYTHAQSELYGVRKGIPWEPFPFAGNAGMTYFYNVLETGE